jgi:hypothetical protein
MIRRVVVIVTGLLLTIPFLIYILCVFRYWGQPPPLDPMVIFRESTIFYFNDMKEIIAGGVYVHPPLLYILNGISFLIFGKSPASYNMLGTIVYAFTFYFFYKTMLFVFHKKAAVLSTLFLFLHPLIIVHSFYLSNDMLIFSALISSMWAYVYKRNAVLLIVLTSLAFMKETALVILCAYLCIILATALVRAWNVRNIWSFFSQIIIWIIPLGFVLLWNMNLKLLGTTEWRDPTFVSKDTSSFAVIWDMIRTGKMINSYLGRNIYHAFLFNFQWVFVTVTGFLLCLRVIQKNLQLTLFQKQFFGMITFILGMYILLVFSFPTWTIPRYVIPVLPGLYILLGILLSTIKRRWVLTVTILILLYVSFAALFTSSDPVTKLFYPSIESNGLSLYSIEYSSSGPDGITYNTQFLHIAYIQNMLIREAILNNADYIVTNCDELKLGERIYSISVNNQSYPGYPLGKPLECLMETDYVQKYLGQELTGKIIFSAPAGQPTEVIQL